MRLSVQSHLTFKKAHRQTDRHTSTHTHGHTHMLYVFTNTTPTYRHTQRYATHYKHAHSKTNTHEHGFKKPSVDLTSCVCLVTEAQACTSPQTHAGIHTQAYTRRHTHTHRHIHITKWFCHLMSLRTPLSLRTLDTLI